MKGYNLTRICLHSYNHWHQRKYNKLFSSRKFFRLWWWIHNCNNNNKKANNNHKRNQNKSWIYKIKRQTKYSNKEMKETIMMTWVIKKLTIQFKTNNSKLRLILNQKAKMQHQKPQSSKVLSTSFQKHLQFQVNILTVKNCIKLISWQIITTKTGINLQLKTWANLEQIKSNKMLTQ